MCAVTRLANFGYQGVEPSVIALDLRSVKRAREDVLEEKVDFGIACV